MESHNKLTLTILFLFSSLAIPQANTLTVGNNNRGFSLELIHRDSVDSPLYPGNLTSVERLQRDIMLSESRNLWLEEEDQASATVGRRRRLRDLNIRPTLTHAGASMYTVKAIIGSTDSHLLLDTGSGLVWRQAEPCNTCFEHDGPRYWPSRSQTFHRLDNRHVYICKPPFHKRRRDGRCTYIKRYGGGRYTRGALGLEQFSFESKENDRKTIIHEIVFGTSYNNSRNMFSNNRRVVGILGMNMAEYSFAMQMASRRFSYCLFPGHGVNSHLRFGTDIIMPRGTAYQRIPLVMRRDRSSLYYYLPWVGISIDGRALNINLPQTAFERCMIDSGAPATFVIQSVYDAIERSLVEYYRGKHLRRSFSYRPHNLRLCYHMPPGDSADTFPSPDVEFHFHGATLRLGRVQLFYVIGKKGIFCLFMIPSEHHTLIGAHAQRNTHFVYDVSERQLHFAPTNSCGGL